VTDPICERSELPASMCGMPCHRSDRTPQEQVAAEMRQPDRPLYVPSPWWTAKHAGWCEHGDHRIVPGDVARYDGGNDGGLECRECVVPE
jgi:hypothetical protein